MSDAQYTAEHTSSVEAPTRPKNKALWPSGWHTNVHAVQSRRRRNVAGISMRSVVQQAAVALFLIAISWLPTSALAQIVGGGPFSTGARNFQTNLLTILAPIAVIGVMVIGVAAWFNRISWGWAAAAAGGLILVFGAPQIVSWIRSMAGV